jgi:predicted amidohydrolase YtcJ
VGGIKIVADGGVETNYLREPYAFTDDPTAPRGKPQVSRENLTAVCHRALETGRQLGIHCVGDAAIDLVLDAFEAAAARNTAPHTPHSLRWTLIHMTLADEGQIARARRLGLCLAVQQPLIYALGAGWVKYWGEERAHRASPMKRYAASGLPVGGGSDSPVTPYQPLLGIWSSVTRATELAGVLGPAWGCSVEEALRMYTRGSAYCSFDEHERGQLAPGFLADLIILAADPLTVPVHAIKDLPIELTLLGGRVVYEGK